MAQGLYLTAALFGMGTMLNLETQVDTHRSLPLDSMREVCLPRFASSMFHRWGPVAAGSSCYAKRERPTATIAVDRGALASFFRQRYTETAETPHAH